MLGASHGFRLGTRYLGYVKKLSILTSAPSHASLDCHVSFPNLVLVIYLASTHLAVSLICAGGQGRHARAVPRRGGGVPLPLRDGERPRRDHLRRSRHRCSHGQHLRVEVLVSRCRVRLGSHRARVGITLLWGMSLQRLPRG